MASLQIDQLCFGRGGKALNQPLTLQASAGQVWAVLGENGAGKSTMLHTLAALLKPVGGQVSVDGVDIRRCPRKLLARRLGLVMQQANLAFPYSVREMVSAGRYAHRPPWGGLSEQDQQAITEALAATALERLAERPINHLSGGEQRRVAIATVLAQQPGVLLMDEPVHNLDVRHQVSLMRHCRQLAESGRVVMFSLHDVNLARQYADRLLLLYPDGAWETGIPDQLLTPQRLQHLFGVPLRDLGQGPHHFWAPEGGE
ncbi:MAG: ABC transporter ATP-binding protein [Halomonadaceae bacterium]|nr:MAG: ABC transporter ATP-binding protein [Halomonadaceae bacterium]